MGRDFSLGSEYPSIIINGRQYYYGKEPDSEGYIVESAHYEKDYWYFKEQADLRAFLINLPESAERDRIRAAHPDWHEVTPEQRDAYLAEDQTRQRALAAEKITNGIAASYNMDLEGIHGPYEPQQIQASASYEAPLDRIERQLRAIKDAGGMAQLTEAGKLRLLEGEFDWTGVSNDEKRVVFAREIDFSQITQLQFDFVYDDIEDDRLEPADAAVAAQLLAESRARSKQGDGDDGRSNDVDPGSLRPVTRGLVTALMLDAQPTPAAMVDFGIDSQRHYEALYYPVREGEIQPHQLDLAYGDGQKLTELTRNAPSNPHKDIAFHTSWDVVLGRDRGATGGGQSDGGSTPSPSEIADQQRGDRKRTTEPA